MPVTYKVLGQSNPSINTDTNIYTTPSGTNTVISTINVCNQAASAATFRIAIRPAGVTLAAQHYIAYDTGVPANDSVAITIGVTLAATDVVTVRTNTATVSFSIFGSEIT